MFGLHQLLASLGPGRSLDGAARRRLESATGSDLGAVRVHDDHAAATAAAFHSARAFTIGDHVAFGAGEYRPGTLVGDAMLAHEVAHTLQQRHATSAGGDSSAADLESAPLELDANRFAVSALHHDRAHAASVAGVQGHTPGLALQRCRSQPTEEQKLQNRMAALDATIADAPHQTFGNVGAAIAEREDVQHDLLVKQRGVGSLHGSKAGAPPVASSGPTCNTSNCTIFVQDVLARTFKAQGRDADWEKVGKKWKELKPTGPPTGIDLQRALQAELGWKAVFWAPDPRRPQDTTSEHPFAFKKVQESGTYYGIAVEKDKSVIDYRPTGSAGTTTNPATMPKVETENLKRLRRVNLGVISMRGGVHMALIVRGKVYEVHWEKTGSDADVITATDLTDFVWQSGAIVMPPEEMTEAWK